MTELTLSGEAALAAGARAAGVQFVSCYPGTPGSNAALRLAETAAEGGYHFEWSVNERVALETAIGASIAGRRALVCVKSVGMNVLVDPLMVLDLSGVHAGLVILLGDDPGAYGSQNDQDSRWIARLAEVPIFEPDTPAAAYGLMQEAFSLSEQYGTAVILRVTRSFIQLECPVPAASTSPPAELGWGGDKRRFFPYPQNAVELHTELHEKLADFAAGLENFPFNRVWPAGRFGVLAAGICAEKLRDLDIAAGESAPSIFELASLYPLPTGRLAEFLAGLDSLLVLEENDSFVESQVRALAQRLGLPVRIYGRESGHVPLAGELFRWQIQTALRAVAPALAIGKTFQEAGEAGERPVRKSGCSPDFYHRLFDQIEAEAQKAGLSPAVIVDPGCQVVLYGRAEAKFSMGSAVAVADGIQKSGSDRTPVAIFGDSVFFHGALPSICNAAIGGGHFLMIVVDNHGATTTGSQPSPNVGEDAWGRTVKRLDIAEIAAACGVDDVRALREDDWPAIGTAIGDGLAGKHLTLLVIQQR